MSIPVEASKVFTEFTSKIANSETVLWLGRQITLIQREFSSPTPFTKVAIVALLVIIPIWLSLEIYQYVSNRSNQKKEVETDQKEEAELKKDMDQVWANIPDEIKQFHVELFEKTSISTSDLPFYPMVISKKSPCFERDKMTAPIMRGKTDDGCPLILIKADSEEKKLKDIIVLHQIFPNGSSPWQKTNDRQWGQLTSLYNHDQAKFFLGNITSRISGKVVESQINQIPKFQDLLAGKAVKCLGGHTWSISKT